MFNNRGLVALGALFGMSMVASPNGIAFDIPWFTIDGGGHLFCHGDDFELSATIGQVDAGRMSGGDFELRGGFWFALEPGDCNEDGIVGHTDYADLECCLKGPNENVIAGCACFDANRSGTVDLLDFATLQDAFNEE